MKIIGESKDSFIIEASKDEVANLLGAYGRGRLKDLKPGTEIHVNKMYHQLNDLAYDRKRYDALADELLDMANRLRMLDAISPAIDKPEPDPKHTSE